MYKNRPFFGSKSNAKIVNDFFRPFINYILIIVLTLSTIIAIVKLGYGSESKIFLKYLLQYQHLMFTIAGIIFMLRVILSMGFGSYTIDLPVYSILSLFIFLSITFNIDKNIIWLNNSYFYALLALGLVVFEISRIDFKQVSLFLNPAQLFMISFGLIIFIGTLLLMLPEASSDHLRLIDALFTATSAVCVTGLSVIDISSELTLLGKSILLILIQVGGIGIMTFTSFFGYFFKGGSTSFSEKFLLSDFLSEDNVSEIAKTLLKVVFITLLIEGIGAIFIFFSLDQSYFPTIEKKIHFAVFHSISAFCNAGFSTLQDGLYSTGTRNCLPLLYSIGFLIIFGGLGFPILLNFYTYFKIKIIFLLNILFFGKRKAVIPQLININTKLVIFTTIFLLITGTAFFYIFENNNSLQGMSISGKIAHSFFGSVTPRTGGFNSVNYGILSIATVVLTIFLMWVGASPVSTGGGIKTTTFSIAILNTLRIARMKNHIEVFKREIHERSVDRAFAIIILSIVILGCSSLILYLFEPSKGALKILFECVSAFSTVGLSLGITPGLNDSSKLLLIFLMFIGRMGILTLLFAVFRKVKPGVYRYPKENIVIN